MQLLSILRARYKVTILVLTLVVTAVLALSCVWPKSYKATTSLVLNYKGMDALTGIPMSALLIPSYMATQVDIASSKNVALAVVSDLRLAENTSNKEKFDKASDGNGSIEDWISESLLKKLEVDPAKESSVLNITFSDKNPKFAAEVANAFAVAYQRVSIRLKVEPAQKASGYFSTQIKLLRDEFENSQKKLSNYQKSNGISSADNQLDVETVRLNELSSQLVVAQSQAIDAASRQQQASANNADSSDVISSPIVQNLKVALSVAEVKFAETSERLNSNHPQYIAAKAELDKLRANLNDQIKIAFGGLAGNARVFQQREEQIRSALASQKIKVINLNSARDELKVLTNEMENARRAYEAANLRLTQTNLEGQFNQSEIAVLNPARAPLEPTGPKIIRNVSAAVLVGVFLGLVTAFTMELLDHRIRTVKDLDGIQVLGIISEPSRRSHAKARAFSTKHRTSNRTMS